MTWLPDPPNPGPGPAPADALTRGQADGAARLALDGDPAGIEVVSRAWRAGLSRITSFPQTPAHSHISDLHCLSRGA